MRLAPPSSKSHKQMYKFVFFYEYPQNAFHIEESLIIQKQVNEKPVIIDVF